VNKNSNRLDSKFKYTLQAFDDPQASISQQALCQYCMSQGVTRSLVVSLMSCQCWNSLCWNKFNNLLITPWDMQQKLHPGAMAHHHHQHNTCWDIAAWSSNACKVYLNLLSNLFQFLFANKHDHAEGLPGSGALGLNPPWVRWSHWGAQSTYHPKAAFGHQELIWCCN